MNLNRELYPNTPGEEVFKKIKSCRSFQPAIDAANNTDMGGQRFKCSNKDCPCFVVTAGKRHALLSGISQGGCVE